MVRKKSREVFRMFDKAFVLVSFGLIRVIVTKLLITKHKKRIVYENRYFCKTLIILEVNFIESIRNL